MISPLRIRVGQDASADRMTDRRQAGCLEVLYFQLWPMFLSPEAEEQGYRETNNGSFYGCPLDKFGFQLEVVKDSVASFETEVFTTTSIANSGTHKYIFNNCRQQRHQSQAQGGIPAATFSRVSSKKVVKPGHKGKGTGKDSQKSSSSGGSKGGKGRGGSNGPPPPDGWRFPSLGDSRPPKTFGCPFYISDPLQFHECSSLRLRRSSDVSQHLMRSHLLRTMRFVRRRDTETTDRAESEESMQQDGTCANANGIRLYHQKCRMEFNGPNAEENLQDHCNNTVCYKAGIEQTGVMLPAEFRALIAARDSVTGGVAKWYAMWAVCFPPLVTTRFRNVPASPYVETTVPRELGEYTIRQALSNGMGDQSLITDQIVNQIYLGDAQTDLEVQQTVQDLQQERDLKLQQADYEAFYRPASSQQAMDWTWDNLPPGQYGGPQ
ncbi:ankyrin 3 [Fusarium denticulatum]|uniref:Ankyrin 3 n=1 Tax=Fusarium denticulatum TaxID=48507 RepID=A0A8H5X1I2_9HYPO|nr:ankyrin 3 [Fusarium denticulatum]